MAGAFLIVAEISVLLSLIVANSFPPTMSHPQQAVMIRYSYGECKDIKNNLLLLHPLPPHQQNFLQFPQGNATTLPPTEVYAEKDEQQAIEAMGKVG